MAEKQESLKCEFIELSIADTPQGKRAFETTSEVLRSRRFLELENELREALFLADFRWSLFLPWDGKFKAAGFAPAYWPASTALDLVPEFELVLKASNQNLRADLSSVLCNPWAFPKSDVERRFGYSTMAGLIEHQICRVITDPHEKLHFIPIDRLRGIQRVLGTPRRRKKAQLISDIEGAADATTLRSLLLEDERGDFILSGGDRALALADWIHNRECLVSLYLITLRTFLNSLEQILSFGSDPGGLYVSAADWPEGCPFCKRMHLRKVTSYERDVPPFHPGCTCNVLPIYLKRVMER
jgi:hypothetical protein